MIYFLYGSDTYSSRRKLRGIISEFCKKTGDEAGVRRIDAAEEPQAIYEVGRTASLFATKELVVIENAPALSREAQDYLRVRIENWAKDRLRTIVFWEGEASEKNELVTALKKSAVKAQEFKPLTPSSLRRWLDAESRARKVRLTPAESEILLARHGADMWAISNELEKIASGWPLGQAKREEEKIWAFTDEFLGHPRRAFQPLMRLLESGYEPIYLLGSLANSLRTLAKILWGLSSGKLKKAASGLHPFVAKKNAELSRNVDAVSLRRLFSQLIEADTELKSGKLPSPLPLLKLILRR